MQKETVCIISDKEWRRVQNQHQHQHRVGQSIINKAESLMTALTCSACALSCLCRGRSAEASDWSQSIVASISNTPSLFPFYCNLHTHSHSLILFCMPRQSHQQRQQQRPRTSMATKKAIFTVLLFSVLFLLSCINFSMFTLFLLWLTLIKFAPFSIYIQYWPALNYSLCSLVY